jgi:dihydroorotate dehydrogenase (NAD+) catalytic subunit
MPKLDLEIPIINGCGTGSYLDVFERLEQLEACFGAYIIKSVGPFSSNQELREKHGWMKEKLGNPNPTVIYTGSVVLNSMALPTHPVESWIEELEKTQLKTPIIGSVWGNKPEDYAVLIDMVDPYVAAWEVNVSCPNKEIGEESVMETMTSKVEAVVKPLRSVTQKPIIVKLSPNEDYAALADLVKEHTDYICCGNTVGPGLVIDPYSRRPVLAGVYGGMSGPAMKPKIMKMVNDVYEVVKGSDVEIVASGGIKDALGVIEYAIAGASLFEIGTCCFMNLGKDGTARGKTTEEIAGFTKRIWQEVQYFLEQQNTTLDELVGSLIR